MCQVARGSTRRARRRTRPAISSSTRSAPRRSSVPGSRKWGTRGPAHQRTSVERLIMHHEIGGFPEADLLQAADSLSFLEVNGPRPRVWVEEGRCDVATAQAKLDWMRDRIAVAAARPFAARFHAAASALLRGAVATIPAAAPRHRASFSVDGPAERDKRRGPGVRRDP